MKFKDGKKEMTEPLAGAAEDSVAAKKPAEIAKNLKSRPRKPRRYIAPEKGRDWYEKAESKIAINENATGTPPRRI
jgi:hypothetical protein